MTRGDVVQALVRDPWYQLSTAGQELFHTNMLYWLAVHRPEQSRPVWDLLEVNAPVDGAVDPRGQVLRQWQHIDLFVDSGMPGRNLVLENKVLAIPTSKQLARYRAQLLKLKGFNDEATSWVLLSLMHPTFRLPEPWRPVGYDDLLPALEATAANLDGEEGQLLAGYAGLVRRLVDVRQAFDPDNDPETSIFLDRADLDVLQQGRVLALIRKMQMSRCAELIAEDLEKHIDGPVPEVGAGLTNTQGFVEWNTLGPQGRHFGWQAQGAQFRLVVITSKRDPNKRAQRERVVEENHLDYFDFSLPSELDGLLVPYSGTKSWLGYEPNFVYRYQTLRPEVTWRQFIDLVVWFSQRAYRYAKEEATR